MRNITIEDEHSDTVPKIATFINELGSYFTASSLHILTSFTKTVHYQSVGYTFKKYCR